MYIYIYIYIHVYIYIWWCCFTKSPIGIAALIPHTTYSYNVAANIANKFLLLLKKHFPKAHKLSKVFNRNNVKVSYSSMPNFASIITKR